MGGKIFDDGIHVTYGPYQSGDTPEFSEDLADAIVSFDIFLYEIRDSRLVPSVYNRDRGSYWNEIKGTDTSWCVIRPDGTVGDYIENLYFTFPVKPEDTAETDTDDEVNHPKHYTGHKADVECIMFTELLPSLAANAFKYVWRCDDKGNHTEDLEKALWYLNRAIESDIDNRWFGRRLRNLVLEIIESSDFDEWHKLVLSKIIRGYYASAYDEIADIIGKPRYWDRHSEE